MLLQQLLGKLAAQRNPAHLAELLLNPTTSPIMVWNSCQPILYNILKPQHKAYMKKKLQPYFENKIGICIGGRLRWVFQNYLITAEKTVNVNVIAEDGQKNDFITDASDLYFAGSNKFDFVCSSHVLEHLTNPIKAVMEWKRVIKPDGMLYCGVPDKRFTFDHKRKRTTMQHIMDDFKKNVPQREEKHIHEALFDINYKLAGMNKAQHQKFIEQYDNSSKKTNKSIYQPHVHVYTKEDVTALFRVCRMTIVFSELNGHTTHIMAKKTKE
jgi:predicted SAM-dependent methyltransferase